MIYWLAVGVWMVLIFIVSVMPIGVDMGSTVPGLGHFLEYAVLGVLLVRAMMVTWGKSYQVSSIYAATLATLYGVAIEIVQIFAPTRYFSVEDMMVNFAGAVTGLTLLGRYRRRNVRSGI